MNDDGVFDQVSAVITNYNTIVTYSQKYVSRTYTYSVGRGFGSGRRGGRVGKRMRLTRGRTRSVSFGRWVTTTHTNTVPDTSAISITLNNGDGTTSQILGPDVTGVFRKLNVGDINGDGILDVAARLLGTSNINNLLIFYGTGGGNLAAPVTISIPNLGDRDIHFGDWNGDDQTDIAWVFKQFDSEALMSIMFQTPDPTATQTQDPAPAPDQTQQDTNAGSGNVPTNIDTNAEPAEIEGAISNIGTGFIEVGSTKVWHTSSTAVQFNDVSGFAIGLTAQVKGNWTTDGQIVASDLEIN